MSNYHFEERMGPFVLTNECRTTICMIVFILLTVYNSRFIKLIPR